jgi:hypothetical protein
VSLDVFLELVTDACLAVLCIVLLVALSISARGRP